MNSPLHKNWIPRNKTHGLSYSRFYKIYYSMLSRCKYKSSKTYNNYGGKGIKLNWKSFKEFKGDMYASYLKHVKIHGEKQTTIDRINNNGNYCKENCRWATYEEQNSNRSCVLKATINGETKTVTQWANTLGLNRSVIYSRIWLGWSPFNAIMIPVKKYKYKK